MYESDDIVKYLFNEYGPGEAEVWIVIRGMDSNHWDDDGTASWMKIWVADVLVGPLNTFYQIYHIVDP